MFNLDPTYDQIVSRRIKKEGIDTECPFEVAFPKNLMRNVRIRQLAKKISDASGGKSDVERIYESSRTSRTARFSNEKDAEIFRKQIGKIQMEKEAADFAKNWDESQRKRADRKKGWHRFEMKFKDKPQSAHDKNLAYMRALITISTKLVGTFDHTPHGVHVAKRFVWVQDDADAVMLRFMGGVGLFIFDISKPKPAETRKYGSEIKKHFERMFDFKPSVRFGYTDSNKQYIDIDGLNGQAEILLPFVKFVIDAYFEHAPFHLNKARWNNSVFVNFDTQVGIGGIKKFEGAF